MDVFRIMPPVPPPPMSAVPPKPPDPPVPEPADPPWPLTQADVVGDDGPCDVSAGEVAVDAVDEAVQERTTGVRLATLGELSGVRAGDLDPDFDARARHGRPRMRFGGRHALIAVLVMVACTCMSLTLLVRQSMNHAAIAAANSAMEERRDGESEGAGTDEGGGADASDLPQPETQGAGVSADGGTDGGAAQTPTVPQDTRLDLNTATLDQLDAISGIGPVTAQRILDYRASIGRFTSVDQLLDVPGIGVKTLEKIRPEVRV
ncbi:ComEA family DNA-binding protein [Bifidobacterium saguinibicoloris]|uniref:ComEA family DNA-binding protein n=1 Tax=Bifidobacterium saguinibicoloris TaxID=2834433 RepID=UPI001C57D778|nr:helix-hairpin-helix domain-containing protein [Bifidobacterium saguinibicoloris]MBW3080098.1 helix-hairpin-helix domain-containing protein [Bifidobacterium saguinibicoloris]